MQDKLDVETAAALKSFSTDMQMKIADNLLQLFGGYGYMTEYPISRFFVDARIQRIYGGTNEIMKEIVARGCWGVNCSSTKKSPEGLFLRENNPNGKCSFNFMILRHSNIH